MIISWLFWYIQKYMATVSKIQKLADINHKNNRFTNMPKLQIYMQAGLYIL